MNSPREEIKRNAKGGQPFESIGDTSDRWLLHVGVCLTTATWTARWHQATSQHSYVKLLKTGLDINNNQHQLSSLPLYFTNRQLI